MAQSQYETSQHWFLLVLCTYVVYLYDLGQSVNDKM
jgi:hypothetical protein